MEKPKGNIYPARIEYSKYMRNPQNPPPYIQKQNLLGPEDTMTMCQFCNATVTTTVKYTATTRTHFLGFLYGLLCCCCCVPHFMSSTKNSDHYCPNCDRYLGTYVK